MEHKRASEKNEYDGEKDSLNDTNNIANNVAQAYHFRWEYE